MRLITVYTSFANKGGAEDVALTLALGLSGDEKPIALHLGSFVFHNYASLGIDYKKFSLKNIQKYHNAGDIFISHHRKTTTYLRLISILLFRNNLRIIHIAHNTFTSLKYFTLFPSHNIAVSECVKKNMIEYFKVPPNRIEVVYNGLIDRFHSNNNYVSINEGTINILFLGRIDPIKRQVEFAKYAKNKLNDNIRIYFAGIGDDYETLKKLIAKDYHFEILGLINPYENLPKFDYVCLFSEKEGLPLSLIEGEMFGKPLITNDIPPCLEINKDGETGFVNHSWSEIIECINSLPHRNKSEYKRLSSNARKSFDSNFNYNSMIEKYKDYINSIDWL